MIKLELISEKNLKEVFEFELENKVFFEKTLPPRPDAYGSFEGFKTCADVFLQDQKQGLMYMHLIRDTYGKVVGRINLFSVQNHEKVTAEVGYRLAEKAQGFGIAKEALKQVIDLCMNEYKIEALTAGTSDVNYASQKILTGRGFQEVGREKQVFKVHDEWINGILYEKEIGQNKSFMINVEAAIYHDGKWLIIKRSLKEEHAGGMLSLVGGTVEANEMTNNLLEQTIIREVEKEIGVKISDDMKYVESNSFITDNGQHVLDVVCLCSIQSGEAKPVSEEEVEAVLWMTTEEVLESSSAPDYLKRSIRKAEELINRQG